MASIAISERDGALITHPNHRQPHQDWGNGQDVNNLFPRQGLIDQLQATLGDPRLCFTATGILFLYNQLLHITAYLRALAWSHSRTRRTRTQAQLARPVHQYGRKEWKRASNDHTRAGEWRRSPLCWMLVSLVNGVTNLQCAVNADVALSQHCSCTSAGLLINAHYFVLLHIDLTFRRRSNCAMCMRVSRTWTFRRPQSEGNGGRLTLGKPPAWRLREIAQLTSGDSAAHWVCQTAPHQCPPSLATSIPPNLYCSIPRLEQARKMVSGFTPALRSRPDIAATFVITHYYQL